MDSVFEPSTFKPLYDKGRKERFPSVLHGCVGALSALSLLHRLKLVHKDVKLDNILQADGEGKLADFGTCADEGSEAKYAGTPGYMPPELVMGPCLNDPSMDMFSTGTTLLCAFAPDKVVELISLNDKFHDSFRNVNGTPKKLSEKERKALIDAYKSEIKKIQKKLMATQKDPWCLIAECIDFDPKNRPKSAAALSRLQAVEEAFNRTGVFVVPARRA